MKRPATLKDIAKETGVHVSTVSRALDPNGQKILTDGVVEKIRACATRMGYRKNNLAFGLRTSRTMTIGVIIPDLTNTLFPPIVRGIESVLEARGYTSIIVNTDNEADRKIKLLDVLLERGVDGIIDAAADILDPKMIDAFEQGLPIVSVNRQIEGSSIPSIINDDAEGIRLLVKHLVEKGHRKIANVAGPQSLTTGRTRLKVFEETLKDLELTFFPDLVEVTSRYDEDEGRRATEFLLDKRLEFTALVCSNDRLAIGALEALKMRDLKCPDHISVTGYNNLPYLRMALPGLTTINIQKFNIGQASAELLLRSIDDPDALIPSCTILPVKLIERGSVKPPSASKH
ncbi:MAG: LacI family DNA-binding transcriptional regulator [Paracoccaceae bacterium]|nr:LacI family DNA-binding transcriptional regulator [Paracoccaceae bacterium]